MKPWLHLTGVRSGSADTQSIAILTGGPKARILSSTWGVYGEVPALCRCGLGHVFSLLCAARIPS